MISRPLVAPAVSAIAPGANAPDPVPAPPAPAQPAAPASLPGDRLTLSAQAAPLRAHEPRRVPSIHQLHPAGADEHYQHGFSNCGPTSMAMVARAYGHGQGQTDAALIMRAAAAGGTDPKKGSSPTSIVAMARSFGLEGTVNGPGPDLAWIDRQLAAGKLVIAHGNYFGLPPHDREPKTWAGGHFLVVAGRDGQGNYLLRDPLDSNIGSVPAADLARFIGSHPSRGHQIAIGAPGGEN